MSAANDVKEKPNIIFLLVDDMGYDSLSPEITPFLKSLQKGGVDMTSYYTQEKCQLERLY
jgi:arylsulfatase A-like enzyme